MKNLIAAFCALLLDSAFAWTQEAVPNKSDNAERARAILRDGLESKDYSMRIEAISASSMIGHNEALIGRLEQFLHDKNVDVRLATANTLGDLHTVRRERILRTVLTEEKTPEVSFAAAKILATSGDAAGIQALMAAYDGSRKPAPVRSRDKSANSPRSSTPRRLPSCLFWGRESGTFRSLEQAKDSPQSASS